MCNAYPKVNQFKTEKRLTEEAMEDKNSALARLEGVLQGLEGVLQDKEAEIKRACAFIPPAALKQFESQMKELQHSNPNPDPDPDHEPDAGVSGFWG